MIPCCRFPFQMMTAYRFRDSAIGKIHGANNGTQNKHERRTDNNNRNDIERMIGCRRTSTPVIYDATESRRITDIKCHTRLPIPAIISYSYEKTAFALK
jgi:hypothetical protein